MRSADGVAPAPAPDAPGKRAFSVLWPSVTFVVDQAELAIPPTAAVRRPWRTRGRSRPVPKSLSRSVRQRVLVMHEAGASTIQSAEDTSGCDMCSVRAKERPLVRSRTLRRTCWPATDTDACIRSPAWIGIRIVTAPAGSSSYQAV